jgi:asparagine synthase (glutamine-hydrolysing)
MPGLYHYLSRISEKCTDVKKVLKTHPDIVFDTIHNDRDDLLFTFGNNNYPRYSWVFDDFTILFIGMVYNYKTNDMKDRVNIIVKNYSNSQAHDYLKLVRNFVRNADGDFIVYAYSKKEHKAILFNDILGRLPLYYYSNGKSITLCSEQKGVLHSIPSIEIDRFQVVNMLTFSHTLASKTIINDVSRLKAGTVLSFNNEYLIKEVDEISLQSKGSTKLSRKNTIKHIADLIEESTKKRVDTLANYNLIADLTGGFDSRIVFGALSKYTKNVDYYTFEYIQDECGIAKELFEQLNSPGNYTKLSFENTVEKEKIPDIVFKTDGLVNYYTSCICYNDVEYLYSNVLNSKTARFGGLGGEFFRHPYKKRYRDLLYGINNGFYNANLENVLDFIDVNKNKYRKYLKEYINVNYDGDIENNLKRFYFYEYYRTVVGLSAEDRERIHFWSVHPLWSKDLLSFFINDFPLKWATYDFFTELMETIDKRLLNVPIYNRNIKLASKVNRLKYDILNDVKTRYKVEIIHFIKNRLSTLYWISRNLKSTFYKKKQMPNNKEPNLFNLTKELGSSEALRNELDNNVMLQTMNIYISELKKLYPNKFIQRK